jgi:hypothetical protein
MTPATWAARNRFASAAQAPLGRGVTLIADGSGFQTSPRTRDG